MKRAPRKWGTPILMKPDAAVPPFSEILADWSAFANSPPELQAMIRQHCVLESLGNLCGRPASEPL
jgi:hypothetical protein